MLEFVNVSGPSGSKDLQTRRKVRSQAMRDFRRRQREEREASKTTKSRQGSPSWSERDRAASTASESTQPPSRKVSKRGKSPKPTHLSSQKEGEMTFQTQRMPSIPQVHFDTSSQETINQWSYDIASTTTHSDPQSQYWHPYASREPSPSLLQEPSMWGSDLQDPFENPAQLQQMLAFCRSYIHWLRPGVRTETAGKIIGEAWKTRPCPMLLAACCLASVGHLDAVQPNRPSGNYEVYKARVLRDVSKRMKSSAEALSDETLGALACLLSFEMSRGSKEASTHLYGLKSLLRAKGGVDRLEFRPLSIMLQTLDLLHAVLFECSPVLTDDLDDITLASSPDDIDADPERLPKPLAAVLNEHDNFVATGPAPYVDPIRSLRALRREAGLVLRDEIDQTYGTTPTTSASPSGDIERYRRALDDFGQASCVEHTEPEAFHFVRCNYFLALIHFNMFARKVPYRHAENQPHIEHLFDAFRRVRNRTWEPLPYMKLLCLLTGAAVTTDPSMQSFFKAELVRTIYLMGVDETPRVQFFILRFIKTRDLLQRPERMNSPAAIGYTPGTEALQQSYLESHHEEVPTTNMPATSYDEWSTTALTAETYTTSAPFEPMDRQEEELDSYLFD